MDVARKSTTAVAKRARRSTITTALALQGGGSSGADQGGGVRRASPRAGVHSRLDLPGLDRRHQRGLDSRASRRNVGSERLRELWNRVSATAPFIPPASVGSLRPAFNGFSVAAAAAFGVPGFFAPRMPSAFFGLCSTTISHQVSTRPICSRARWTSLSTSISSIRATCAFRSARSTSRQAIPFTSTIDRPALDLTTCAPAERSRRDFRR